MPMKLQTKKTACGRYKKSAWAATGQVKKPSQTAVTNLRSVEESQV